MVFSVIKTNLTVTIINATHTVIIPHNTGATKSDRQGSVGMGPLFVAAISIVFCFEAMWVASVCG